MTIALRMAVCAGLAMVFCACGAVGATDVRGNCMRACAAGCQVWDPTGTSCSDSCDAAVAAATANGCLDEANIYFACQAGTTCSSGSTQCVSQGQAYTACIN